MIEFEKSTTLQRVKTTTDGIILLGSSISKDIEFHSRFIQSKIDEARHTLHAITLFGKEYLQQATFLLKSCFISKFSYLSRVTPPHLLEPFTLSIMNDIRIQYDRAPISRSSVASISIETQTWWARHHRYNFDVQMCILGQHIGISLEYRLY